MTGKAATSSQDSKAKPQTPEFEASFDDRPIGVFDSGIGGLTVLKELEKAFPQENFIYLGDTARLPYGSKSSNTIKKYVEQNIKFFLEQKDIKALVLACNSASTVLEDLDIPKHIEVFGVIQPGAETALKTSKSKKIGLWATRATVNGQAYAKALKKLNPDHQYTATACPLLVPLVEEGLWDHPLTLQAFELYLDEIIKAEVDTLILGCTHYPLIKASLQKYLDQKGLKQIQIIDSAIALTEKIKNAFEKELIRPAKNHSGPSHICLTDDSEHFKSIALKAFPEWKLNQFELVCI